MTRRPQSLALALGFLLLALDQWTKHWALQHLLPPGDSVRLPGPVDLTLSLNQSNAFSLAPVAGDLTRWALTFANLAVAATLLVFIIRGRLPKTLMFGLALVMSGAVGNAVDRLQLGAVVDFLDATKIGFPWIFNVADATIDTGIALIGISAFRSRATNDS